MPDRSSKKKRPSDAKQLAKAIVGPSTGETEEPNHTKGKTWRLYRSVERADSKGGKARAA